MDERKANPMTGKWQDIETPPEKPCGVLYWCPNSAHEADDDVLTHGWDYSIQIGYWDGRFFHDQGTGHLTIEREDYGDMPTHWMPLPDPPQHTGKG